MRNLGGFFMPVVYTSAQEANMPEQYNKPAVSFADQLELLKSRGLVVGDDPIALSQLSSISYYRLSAYWYPYRERNEHGSVGDNFIEGTSFEDVINLYEFDRHLRLLVIDALERIEVYIRTLISYQLTHAYGAFGHNDPTNYHPNFKHAKWLASLSREAERSSDAFIAHYKNKYSGFPELPLWMITEVMSLGSLSFAYKGLKHTDKKAISNQLGLHHKSLADWLHKLTYIRNVCAHHSRLWNRELSLRPSRPRGTAWNTPITPRNDRVFYVLLMLRYLLKTTSNGLDWCKRCNELLEPIARVEKWRNAMGMPENWEEHPLWK